jgi:acyl-CoA reductase-like NAD-dependent aldehyde dehydrogenase
MDEATQVGPLISKEAWERVGSMVQEAIDAGATCYAGGSPLDRDGWFFSPTLLGNIPQSCSLSKMEVFGPVLQIYPYKDINTAVEMANSLHMGLTASVFGKDRGQLNQVVSLLDAGTIGVNQIIGSVVDLPWGGRKKAGLGRMLGSPGLKEFTEPVVIREA